MAGNNYLVHLEAEKIEYDERYAQTDIHMPLKSIVDPRVQSVWDSYVGQLTGKNVLEVGSGDGHTACWLASLGATVSAVELSPVGIAMTRERAGFHHLENLVTAYCMDACQLDTVIPANSIDVTLGFSVLHHLPPVRLGRSLRTVLKDGGKAVFF